MLTMHARHSTIETLKLYLRPRQLVVFALGISSGMPLTLLLTTLFFWLSKLGIDRTTIGLFAILGTPYTLKFLWSPLVDRLPVPILGRMLGRRRAWLVLAQAGLIPSIIMLGASDPVGNIALTAWAAFFVAFFSATQDIVIDAYRIESLKPSEQGAGSAMVIGGYRIGNLISGAAALLIAGSIGYEAAFLAMACIVPVGLLAALLAGEPKKPESSEADAIERSVLDYLADKGATGIWTEYSARLYMGAVAPFQEFMKRRGWFAILAFIVIYKAGDALASVMTAPLIQELGFSEIEMAYASKTVAVAAVFAGTYLGGGLLYLVGMYRALMIAGVLMMVTNLSFAALAYIGYDLPFLIFTVAMENLATGLGLSVFVAYLSGLCNIAFTATQYALLSSLSAVGRTWISAGSGEIVDRIGWVDFFVFTTFAAIPGLILLHWLWKAGFQVETPARAEASEPA